MAINTTTDDFSDFFQPKGRPLYKGTDPILVEGTVMGRPGVKAPVKKATVKKRANNKYSISTIEKATAPVDSPSISRTPGFSPIGRVAEPTTADAIGLQTDQMKQEAESEKNSKMFLAAANFGLSVFNANSAYGAIQSASQLNILEARRLAGDAITRGKQRALEAQVEGEQVGKQALLSLAAQGQDVQGAAVQKVQGSFEDIGLYNALQEETNAITESLGFDLEEVSIGFQLDQAEIARDTSIISAGLNLGASYYANTL